MIARAVVTNRHTSLVVEDAEMVAWFLERGASPNTRCDLDLTPLSIAVCYSSMAIIQSLFDQGGCIKFGQLLHHAIRRDLPDQMEVFDLILSKGPPINHVMNQEYMYGYYMQRCFGLGTPLQEAAELGKLDMVKRLIEEGAHPLIRNSRGKVPLGRARDKGQDAVVDYLGPITAMAEPPAFQFTEGKETTGWS